jgi:hypothetical protein
MIVLPKMYIYHSLNINVLEIGGNEGSVHKRRAYNRRYIPVTAAMKSQSYTAAADSRTVHNMIRNLFDLHYFENDAGRFREEAVTIRRRNKTLKSTSRL